MVSGCPPADRHERLPSPEREGQGSKRLAVAKIDHRSGGLRPGKRRPFRLDHNTKMFIISELHEKRVLEFKMPYCPVGQEVAYEEHV